MNKSLGYIICEASKTEMSTENVVSDVNGRPTIEGPIQDVNNINRNGRIYADNELVPKLKDDRMVELLESRNLFGEAGHPMSKELSRQQTIDPNNLSHLFEKIWVDGDKIMAHISAADTNVGDNFNRLIKSGTKVAFSLRALGNLVKTSKGSEVKDIRIITWDWVIYPSHKVAYMDKFVNLAESCLDNGNQLIMNESSSGLLVPITKNIVTDYIKDKSDNLKCATESLEFLYDSITINEAGNMIELVDKTGDKLCVHLETQIRNEIMDYCSRIKKNIY